MVPRRAGWLLLLVACGTPDPSVTDPRFDELRLGSAFPVDGDLDEEGDLAVVTGRFTPLSDGDASIEVVAFVDTFDHLLSVSSDQLVAQGAGPGVGGSEVASFGIEHQGLPVFDAHVVGEVSPPWGVTTLITHVPRDLAVETTPSVTAEQAIAAAQAAPDVEFSDADDEPALGIFNAGLYLDEPSESALAWRVPLADGDVFVDATVGDVLWVDHGEHEALDLALYSAGNSDDKAGIVGWGDRQATRIPWMSEDGPVQGASPSAVAQRAFEDIHTTHAFFEDEFGYSGIDGAGLVQTEVYVHYGDPGHRNAFFQRTVQAMFFGDGATYLDVMAHEYTHGIVSYTAGLRYAAFSGALNESLADSFAAFVDEGDPWSIGEDLRGGPLRRMDNPRAEGDPDHWKRRQRVPTRGRCAEPPNRCAPGLSCVWGKCVDVSRATDRGGVHTNSGIPNKATWLLAVEPVDSRRRHAGERTRSIGQDKLAPLMMDTLQLWLRSSSGFGRYARAMVATCKAHERGTEDGLNEAGVEIEDCGAVINAMHAVGIHKGPDEDEDAVRDEVDRCPKDFDPDQEDSDRDGIGDACDDVDGAEITIRMRHTHERDEQNIHILLPDEGFSESQNRIRPGRTRTERYVATGGEVILSVGRGGTVFDTTDCGWIVEGGEYEAHYHEGFGLQSFGFDCWRVGPGNPPPDPTEEPPPEE